MQDAFGGNFFEIIGGGAAMNREAEKFFHKIGLRYTMGYGMTECAPIICYVIGMIIFQAIAENQLRK